MYSAVGESYLDGVLELERVMKESRNVVTFSNTMSESVTYVTRRHNSTVTVGKMTGNYLW